MIAVDTSAIVAIIQAEPSEENLRGKLERAGGALISTANLLELQVVMANKRSLVSWPDIEALLAKYCIAAHPFEERQLAIARDAAIRFGRGRHKAGLNYGDCFAYALARAEALRLLCTGEDFAQTDIMLA